MEQISKKAKVIYDYLLSLINSNHTNIGSQLPSEHELRDKFYISRPTIGKALALLESEGYIYKVQGRGSYVNKKGSLPKDFKKISIGLLFPLLGIGEIFNPITEELIKLSERYNFNLIWGGQFNPSDSVAIQMNQMIDFYLSNNVSGLIMAPIERSQKCLPLNQATIKKIKRASLPLVLVDGDYLKFPKRSEYDLVCIDNYRVGYITATHLVQQGAKRVDYCSYAHSAQTVTMRIKGYKDALMDANIAPSEDWVHSGDPSAIQFVNTLLDSGGRNFICSNDSVAFELMKNFSSLGYDIPSQVRVVGVDDVNFSKYSNISMTTVQQPCKEIAQVVIETLLSRINNPLLPVRTIMLNSVLKVRDSSIIA